MNPLPTIQILIITPHNSPTDPPLSWTISSQTTHFISFINPIILLFFHHQTYVQFDKVPYYKKFVCLMTLNLSAFSDPHQREGRDGIRKRQCWTHLESFLPASRFFKKTIINRFTNLMPMDHCSNK